VAEGWVFKKGTKKKPIPVKKVKGRKGAAGSVINLRKRIVVGHTSRNDAKKRGKKEYWWDGV